ncbi:MAG: Fibronectin type domain protein [Herbinix sp.]|nr:Fibronectin type domain protein [Herbinix sp.]
MFNPKAKVTRAEASVKLCRYIRLTIDSTTTQGWAKNDNGERLYYQAGKALTGWFEIDEKWYYFYSDGLLAVNTNINGYGVDKDGVRITK